MYCTFTTCMYVYMLMYMTAYICVCIHVYVIHGSEGLRKMWDFKQTQKQNSDLKITVTKHISKGRRGTLTTESWRRSSRLSRSGYSFRANCCTSAAWAPRGWLCRFRKTVWGRHKVRSQREISPQLIKKKKKEASESLHAGVRNTAAGPSTMSAARRCFFEATSVATKHESASPAPCWAKELRHGVFTVLCWRILHQMHQQAEWNGAKHDITTSFSPLGCLFPLASSPLRRQTQLLAK